MNSPEKRFPRFDIVQRVEHLILLLSFTLLGLTGLPQKYSQAGVSQWVIAALGGIESVRIIHRVSATVFVLLSIYHFVMVGYKLFVLRKEASMLPGIQDLKDAFLAFGHNLGIVKNAPKMPRYNFTEKAEYWALLWGLVLMGVTGFMLWNPIATTRLLPGQFIPAAKAAHGGEAVLAVLAIIIWHFYHVHLKRWNWSMIKGSLSREEMEEEHALELEKLDAAQTSLEVGPQEIRRRMRIYLPVAGVVSVVGIVAVTYFITFEQTAITTLPPAEQAQIYVPQTPTPFPPTATPEPTSTPGAVAQNPAEGTQVANSWDNGIGAIFEDKCSVCHGKSGGLSLKVYADAMKGGSAGPVIVPGDPDNSLVINKVKGGDHPGKLTPDELKVIADWIKAGAPEK
jgi:cytochrome b subunit of formate dehydrogenase/mono/diheme cytochrome c family protein